MRPVSFILIIIEKKFTKKSKLDNSLSLTRVKPLSTHVNFVIIFRIFQDKNKKHFHYLMAANNQTEWLWSFFFKFAVFGYLLNNVSMCAVPAFLCYWRGQSFDTNLLYHPFKVL